MSPSIARLAVPLAASLLAAAAAAQPVYRCGNEYTRVPCPGGRSVETPGSPSARDRAAAERRLAVEQRQAVTMAADRERRDAAPRRAAANVGPAPAAAAGASAVANLKPPKKAKGRIRVVGADDFTARVPRTKKPKARSEPPAP